MKTLDENAIIVVRTDLKGNITSVNDDFLRISEYDREEIIGHSYKSLFSADMPNDVLTDLWSELSQIRPWSGIVKNNSKNNSYWTQTNAIIEFSNVEFSKKNASGYLFVSFNPTKSDIDKAQNSYSGSLVHTQSVTQKFFNYCANIPFAIKNIASTAVGLFSAIFVGQSLWSAKNDTALAAFVLLTLLFFEKCWRVNAWHNFLKKSVVTFYKLSAKQFRQEFDLKKGGIEGDFYRGLFSMDVSLNLILDEMRHHQVDFMRVSDALNNTHSAVTVADKDFNIILVNKRAELLLSEAEDVIRTQLPHFNAKKILGANIDSFHANPEKQRKILKNVTGFYASEIVIADRILTVVVNPVLNEGEKIGYIAEWIDKSKETRAIQDVTDIIDSASNGNFDTRVSERGKQGFVLELSKNLNGLLSITANSLKDIQAVLSSISSGDLNARIEEDYCGTFEQIKNDVNFTVRKLAEIITEIQETTEIINQSSRELAAGNEDLSQRTESQAASLRQTSTSLQSITVTVQKNSENAKYANQLALSASDAATNGTKVMQNIVNMMEKINESSHKISDIITVIDGISFQTNILALNAAVEAARAGDQGRGFAVVAEEVRNLAQRASIASGEIRNLINDSAEQIEMGTSLVETATGSIKEIVDAVSGVTQVMDDITRASDEQAWGIQQVNQAVIEIDTITQQNAALVEQATTSTRVLEETTYKLLETASYFKH